MFVGVALSVAWSSTPRPAHPPGGPAARRVRDPLLPRGQRPAAGETSLRPPGTGPRRPSNRVGRPGRFFFFRAGRDVALDLRAAGSGRDCQSKRPEDAGGRDMPVGGPLLALALSAVCCPPGTAGCWPPSPPRPPSRPGPAAAAPRRLTGPARARRGRPHPHALLAAVGHDLRTPLAGIKAAVTSLRSDDVAWSEEDEAELLEGHQRRAPTASTTSSATCSTCPASRPVRSRR